MSHRNRLFIGNIPHSASSADLKTWVESHGFFVESADVILDKVTGKSRGFGFVTLRDAPLLEDAIAILHRQRMEGRVLTVNEANPVTSPR